MSFNAGDVEAKLKLDRTEFKTEMHEAQREVEDFERTYEATLKLSLDNKSATITEKRIKQIAKTYEAKLKLTVVGMPAVTKASQKLRDTAKTYNAKLKIEVSNITALTNVQKQMQSIRNRGVNIRINDKNIYNDLMRLNATLNRVTRDRTIILRAKTDFLRAHADMRQLNRSADILSTKKINIKARVDGSNSFIRDITKMGSSADSVGSSMGGLSTRMQLLGGAILIGAAPAVGYLTGLLLSLPGVMALVGQGAAVVALGMDGIQNAIAFLNPQIELLQQTISNTFQAGLLPIVQKLVPLFPILTRNMQGTAQALIGWAGAFTNVITSAQGMNTINQIMQNVNRVIVGLTPSVGNMTNAFLTLAQVGTQNMGVMVDLINRFTAGFNNMIQSAAQSGLLKDMFIQLGNVTNSLLQAFLKLIDAGMKWLVQTGPALTQFFDLLGTTIDVLQPILTTITNTFMAVFGPALKIILDVLQRLTPAFQVFGELIGQLVGGTLTAAGPLIGDLASMIGDVLLTAFNAIRPIIPIVVGALGNFFNSLRPIIPVLGDFIKKLIEQLAPYLPQIAQAFSKIVEAFVQMLPHFISLAEKVLPMVVPLFGLFAMGVGAAAENLAKIAGVLSTVAGGFYDVLSAIVGFIGDLPTKIGEFFSWLGTKLSGVGSSFGNAFQGAVDWVVRVWQGIPGFFSGLWDSIITGLGNAASAVGTFLLNLPQNIARGLGQTIGTIAQWAIDASLAFKDWGTNALKAIGTFFAELPGNLLSLLSTANTWLIKTGGDILSGLWHGIQNGYNAVNDFFISLPGKIGTFFSNAIDWLSTTGLDILKGLLAGIVNGYVAVNQWFVNLPETIKNLWSGANTWLIETGWNILSGLWQGIQNGWNAFWGWIGSLIDSFIQGFKEGFGIASPSTVMMEIGGYIIQGLWQGIQNLWSGFMQWLGGTLQGIVSTFSGAWIGIQQAATTIWSMITQYFYGVWAGISAWWNNLWNTVSNFFRTIWGGISGAAQAIWSNLVNLFSGIWIGITVTWNALWTTISNFFSSTWNDIKSKATDLWNRIVNYYSGVWNQFTGLAQRTWDSVKNSFATVMGALSGVAKSAWDRVVAVIKSAANALIGVINGMIGGVNVALGAVGIPQIPRIPFLESGGVIKMDVIPQMASGGNIGKGFVTNGPTAVVGEGSRIYPEYVIPTDPRYRDNAKRLYSSLGNKLNGIQSNVTNIQQLSSPNLTTPQNISNVIMSSDKPEFDDKQWQILMGIAKQSQEFQDIVSKIKSNKTDVISDGQINKLIAAITSNSGNITAMLPQDTTIKELVQEIMFLKRHANRGVLSGRYT